MKKIHFQTGKNMALSGRSSQCIIMNSQPLGKPISAVEVTNISRHGIWLLAEDMELFLSFEHFPWFQDPPARV